MAHTLSESQWVFVDETLHALAEFAHLPRLNGNMRYVYLSARWHRFTRCLAVQPTLGVTISVI